MKRTILKLFLVCVLAAICASGADKIPSCDPPPDGGGGCANSTCVAGDGTGFVCVCTNCTTCVTGRNLPCSCV